MKKILFAVTMVVTLAIAGAAFSFSSTGSYSFGKPDREFTMAVAGCEIEKGEWVVMSYSDANGYEVDTGSIVTLTATENTSSVVGVATMACDTGAMLTILVHGFCDYAKIDGVDSGAAGAISRGNALAIAPKRGYAGSALGTVPYVGAVTAQSFGTQIIGYAVDAVTGRANAAAFADTSTSYDVFVTCR